MFAVSLTRQLRRKHAVAVLVAAAAMLLVAPVAARADTIGSSFTIGGGGGSTSTVAGSSATFYYGGSQAAVWCGKLPDSIHVNIPTDLSVPSGAVWEYWEAALTANPEIVVPNASDGVYGGMHAQGGTVSAWSTLFARNLSNGGEFYRLPSGAWSPVGVWTALFVYDTDDIDTPFAIHDWAFFVLANGTTTSWIDEGYRAAGAYQGPLHGISMPDCLG